MDSNFHSCFFIGCGLVIHIFDILNFKILDIVFYHGCLITLGRGVMVMFMVTGNETFPLQSTIW